MSNEEGSSRAKKPAHVEVITANGSKVSVRVRSIAEIQAWMAARDVGNPELKTVGEIQEHWVRVHNHYTRSETRAAVRQILEQNRPEEGWKIEAAVIFATGKFALRDKSGRDTHMLQLAAFLDMVAYLRSDNPGVEIPVFAQDPMYRMGNPPLDEQFLAGLNVHMVDDPMGQRLIRRNVFGFIACMVLESEIADQCAHLQPKLWIGNDLGFALSFNRNVLRWSEAEHPDQHHIPEGEKLPERQELRAVGLRAFGARHRSIPWPSDVEDMAAEGAIKQNIDRIWIETPETRREMADDVTTSCQHCVGGKRDGWRSPCDLTKLDQEQQRQAYLQARPEEVLRSR